VNLMIKITTIVTLWLAILTHRTRFPRLQLKTARAKPHGVLFGGRLQPQFGNRLDPGQQPARPVG